MTLFEYSKTNPVIIAGPCVMESYELMAEVAQTLADIKARKGYRIVFKASFDKANRTSVSSFRGPGLEKGLTWLSDIKATYGLEVTTDIHESHQAAPVGQVVDVVQIPAFLCRQTDLVVEAGKTGKIVNIKKAQFLTAADMKYPAEKVLSTGNSQIWLTERGNMLGYNNLVVDFRNIPALQQHGFPVIMDCTHAVQQPGGGVTGGNRALVKPMALAAKAFGADGYFFEVHPEPEKGLSDAANMYRLSEFEQLLDTLLS
ncbi:2-dehydro-3-deoxyphosphooctonate aldolase [Thermaurantimonas aggregans]|uniref:3-deoxy-8-phosphooctulonate synthase n=1 Tax=Thermaurantimonas aggregans TaxID=2173829 RepID=A0A401XP13_9FLAO|nr:3-deoxy-8-phosphooctulonate synthase [Thermaurantimonas aggregans]MCX8148100.1 3-deoxy-8-phosphooctulonate synthase [Thermaurantimonas aggregans]GCD78732.1 2-dehydro-3-deoxyphosphooctonate aldolase [Thermaurantimonas aggregans]